MSSRFHDLLRQFTTRDAHPFIQFTKYGMAGGLATAVDIVIFSFLAWKVFPALREGELIVKLFHLDVPQLDATTRTINFSIAKVLTFLVSNFVAYITNVLWVFHPGRHSRKKEVILFYIVSTTSFVIGLALGALLIKLFNVGAAPAYLANMVAAVMINYVCRKYIVFKG